LNDTLKLIVVISLATLGALLGGWAAWADGGWLAAIVGLVVGAVVGAVIGAVLAFGRQPRRAQEIGGSTRQLPCRVNVPKSLALRATNYTVHLAYRVGGPVIVAALQTRPRSPSSVTAILTRIPKLDNQV
jgi:hypothetical protein